MIINDNTELMKFVPNVVSAVEGEMTLYEKLQQWLVAAEQWVQRTFTGSEIMARIDVTEDPHLYNAAARVVVSEALRLATPSLDIVITPNGFGVVNTANVAPASKERVERLIATLVVTRDQYINFLLSSLAGNPYWRGTPQAEWFTATTISWPKACIVATYDEKKRGKQWDNFVELRERAKVVEQFIEEECIDKDTLDDMRQSIMFFSGDSDMHRMAMQLRALVLQELRTGYRDKRAMDRIINFMREHLHSFPMWAESRQRQLYENPPVHRNEKRSSGYFF